MADDSRKKIHEATKVCPVCGRQFWCYDVSRWAYRERTGKMRHICSWNCQAKHNAELDAKRAKRQKYRVPSEVQKLWDCMDQGEPHQQTVRTKKDVPNAIEPKRTEERPAKKKVGYHWIVNLAEIMREKGVSERVLAERSGIRRASIGQWRRADTRCPEYKLDILADALGISKEEILVSDIRPDVVPVVREPKEEKVAKEWHWLVNLGEIMQEKGLSRRDLAKRTGIPRGTIDQWRRLGAKCQGYKLDILADALGVPREALAEKKNGTV